MVKKLSLEEIKVQSFVTELDASEQNLYGAGSGDKDCASHPTNCGTVCNTNCATTPCYTNCEQTLAC